MAFLRFRKSIKIIPGVKLNISKSGVGVSTGVRGARVGVNSRGSYSSVGIPGSGLYMMSYSRKSGRKTAQNQMTNNETNAGVSHYARPAIKTKTTSMIVWLGFIDVILFFINWLLGIIAITLTIVAYNYYFKKQPSFIAKQGLKKAQEAYKKGDYKTSAELFGKAHDFFKDDIAITLWAASSYSCLKEFDKAIDLLEEYLSGNPMDYEMKYKMALWQNEINRKDDALKTLQSLPTDYDNSDALLLMSEILTDKKLYSAAIDTLKRAPLKKKVLRPDLIEILYNLGVLYEKADDKKRAQVAFERVYAYDNSFKDVAEKVSKV
jgi:tetratricopeptide (TPR) repeat protein